MRQHPHQLRRSRALRRLRWVVAGRGVRRRVVRLQWPERLPRARRLSAESHLRHAVRRPGCMQRRVLQCVHVRPLRQRPLWRRVPAVRRHDAHLQLERHVHRQLRRQRRRHVPDLVLQQRDMRPGRRQLVRRLRSDVPELLHIRSRREVRRSSGPTSSAGATAPAARTSVLPACPATTSCARPRATGSTPAARAAARAT